MSLSSFLSCSHKMFALFGAFCLLLLQATLTPAQVSWAKLRARITCLYFQKVDRPKPPSSSSVPVVTTICWSIVLVAWFVLFAKYRKYFNYRVGFKLKLCSWLGKRAEREKEPKVQLKSVHAVELYVKFRGSYLFRIFSGKWAVKLK